ncbi:hypothetical protein [Bacillus subtilis]
MIPIWDCVVCNNSSITLPAKLGFKPVTEYSFFILGNCKNIHLKKEEKR